MAIEELFTLDLPPASPVAQPIEGEGKAKRPRMTAAEKLQRKKDREEAAQRPPAAATASAPAPDMKLDLTEAAKTVGTLLVLMSKTKKPLEKEEINSLARTAEQSMTQILGDITPETSKWLVHGNTLATWLGTLAPRFVPNLFEKKPAGAEPLQKPQVETEVKPQ